MFSDIYRTTRKNPHKMETQKLLKLRGRVGPFWVIFFRFFTTLGINFCLCAYTYPLVKISLISDPFYLLPTGPKSLHIEDMCFDIYRTTKKNPKKMGSWKAFKPIKGGMVGKIRPRLPPVQARGKRGPILTKVHRGY